MSPARKRAAVRHLQAKRLSSQRRACWLVEVSRSSLYYVRRKRPDEDALRARIKQIAKQRSYWGYRLVWGQLRREGWRVNHKRVHRIWREEGLDLRRRRRGKRSCGPKGEVQQRATHPDNVWSYDICEDRTERGRQLRVLSVLDEFTRECLAIEVAHSISAQTVVDLLEWLALTRGTPEHIRSDNGPEFIAQAIQRWLAQVDVQTLYIEPGSPWENGYAESFHSRLRDEFLALEVFENLAAARKLTMAWKEDYNHHRPHSSLGYMAPAEYAARCCSSVRAAPSLQNSSGFTLTQTFIPAATGI